MNDRDPVTEALTRLDVPPLDPTFAKRVGAIAELELRASAPGDRKPMHWMPALRGALVPALLATAALAQTATIAATISKIYGHGLVTSAQ